MTDRLYLKVMVKTKIYNLSKEKSIPKYDKGICTDVIETDVVGFLRDYKK